jgi:hypothetical protein
MSVELSVRFIGLVMTKAKKNQQKNGKGKTVSAKQQRKNRRRQTKPAMKKVKTNFIPMNFKSGVEERLIKSYMLPTENPPIRHPCDPPVTTATFQFEQVTETTIPTTGASFLVFKDPCFPLWKSSTFTARVGLFRFGSYSNYAAQEPPVFPTTRGASVSLDEPPGWYDNTGMKSSGGDTIPSELYGTLPFGQFVDDSGTWFYVPQGAVPYFNIGSTMANLAGGMWTIEAHYSCDALQSNVKDIVLQCQKLTGGVENNVVEAIGDAAVCPPGWYRLLRLACTTPTTDTSGAVVGNVAIGWLPSGTTSSAESLPTGTFTGFFPMSAVGRAEMANSSAIYYNARLNAGSFLFQNVTAVLNKEGPILAGVIATKERKIYEKASLDVYLNDLKTKLRHTGRLEHGLYTFMQPQMSTTGLQDSLVTDQANTPESSVARLGSYLYVYYIKMSPAEHAQRLEVTYTCHHECQSDSMLFPTGFSRLPVEDVRQAMLAAMEIVPFMDNPIHFSYLAQVAKQLAGQAWNRAKPHFNPMAHRAVDYLIPKYGNLAIRDRPTNPYR